MDAEDCEPYTDVFFIKFSQVSNARWLIWLQPSLSVVNPFCSICWLFLHLKSTYSLEAVAMTPHIVQLLVVQLEQICVVVYMRYTSQRYDLKLYWLMQWNRELQYTRCYQAFYALALPSANEFTVPC
jgi:hypothetical protein